MQRHQPCRLARIFSQQCIMKSYAPQPCLVYIKEVGRRNVNINSRHCSLWKRGSEKKGARISLSRSLMKFFGSRRRKLNLRELSR